MFLSKPVLYLCAVLLLGALVFGVVEYQSASKSSKDNSALKAQLAQAKESSSISPELQKQLQGITDKLDELSKSQADLAKKQADTNTQTPTAEIQAEDKVAQDNLKLALKATDKIYQQGKSYKAVTPAAAKLVEPDLKWQSGKPSTAADKIDIVSATKSVIQLCALSDSSTVFCIQEDQSGRAATTYGQGDTESAALKALASDGWSETSNNTQSQPLPFGNDKTTTPPKK